MLGRISRREEFELFIAWIALSIAFAIYFIRAEGITNLSLIAFYFGISFLTAGIAFVFHEMAHKFSAIKFGFRAEFRKNDVMLLVSLILAALSVGVFAAPGATVIYTGDGRDLTKREDGIISAAGPVVNLLLCVIFAALFFLAEGKAGLAGGNLLAILGITGVQINAMIAAFNLLPISILDGRKVFAWNKAIFFILIIAAFGTLVAAYFHLRMLI